ncbi:hypothetical protein Gotri_007766 [Gossypium trilobum]|uniref:transketolase n=1 Tax=Gossypium trilobum TaxID=34281 RepID=A0A7J9EH56_9ROSI|nr:hypothetical protein [Gossypium trilobum]
MRLLTTTRMLIAFYDDNHISLDGDTEIAFIKNVDECFKGLGWHVIWVKNGNTGYDKIRAAIKEAKAVGDKPTLIKVTTTIGYGSPNKANSYNIHGSALGAKEVDATRKNLTWPHEPFHVPEDVKRHWSRHVQQGADLEVEWNAKFAEYEKKFKDEVAELKLIIIVHPGFLGGSADLASSNMTLLKMYGNFQKDTPEERNLRFGVREHGMGVICNSITYNSPDLILYCATFFVFTGYMIAAIRMSALSQAGVIYVMTHDSIGSRENGPTQQPIEHLASFRAMPNVFMLRPTNGNETAGAYKVTILNRNTHSIIALSQQELPQLSRTSIEGVEKGGYIILDNFSGNNLDIVLIGTGSELEIDVKAANELRKGGKAVRVISLISWELFDNQSNAYKESVLPSSVSTRLSIEAGSTFGWEKIVGLKGKAIGIDWFGASAPTGRLYKEFGLTPEVIVATAKELC